MKEMLDMCIQAMQAGVTLGTDGIFYSYMGDSYRGDSCYIGQDPVLPECDTLHDVDDMRRRLEAYYIDNSTAMEMDREWLSRVIHRLSTVSTS